jgi:hypothetical protein
MNTPNAKLATSPLITIIDPKSQLLITAIYIPSYLNSGLSSGRFQTDRRTDGRSVGRWPRGPGLSYRASGGLLVGEPGGRASGPVHYALYEPGGVL